MKDGLSLESITANLKTHFIGRRIIYHQKVTSTNELARQEAEWGAADGTVVIGEEQTAGRGRLNHVWLSPRGNVALSIILHPGVACLPCLIMLASVAVAHSIETVTGLKPRLKWPNDVVLNDRKVAGILIENKMRGCAVNYAIIGVGINVNLKLADFPGILPAATSLSDELGRDVSRSDLICCLLAEMERLYLAVSAGGSVYEQWRDYLVTLGREICITSGEVDCEGVAESVASDGSLLVRCRDGSLVKIVAGDVILSD